MVYVPSIILRIKLAVSNKAVLIIVSEKKVSHDVHSLNGTLKTSFTLLVITGPSP
jgi:hypothetical protein